MDSTKITAGKPHPHAEMIKEKADNMELVVFCKDSAGWFELDEKIFPRFNAENEYFLCLPEHKEPCLHWLNGGEIQDYFEGEWADIKPHNGNPDWNEPDQLFMNDEFELRISPRKEKRWIRVRKNGVSLDTMTLFNTKDHARGDGSYQIFEIEVEV